MKASTKKLPFDLMLGVNVAVIATILVLNYFYQSNGFDFTLKCVCSGLFALLGVVNLVYAGKKKEAGMKFRAAMTAGLILAFAGDVLIGYDFIVGAATFALGHICFVAAYCFLQRLSPLDWIASGVLFAVALAFLLLCPLLVFPVPVFKIVCVVYALIICLMLGKAIGNYIRKKNMLTGVIASASALFFFSDLMLVLDRFIGLWSWTGEACMGTYYPALCLLAFSVYIKNSKSN